jgi:hypothetical protein
MNKTLPENVRIGEAVLYQTLQDEVVLLNMENQQYYGLNDTGARMWKLLMELQNLERVTERLDASYDVDPALLRTDFQRLVSDLLQRGLLQAA